MKRLLLITFALALIALPVASQTNVTVAAGGVYPSSTTFSNVPINGLQSGYGVDPAFQQQLMSELVGWQADVPQGGVIWVFALSK